MAKNKKKIDAFQQILRQNVEGALGKESIVEQDNNDVEVKVNANIYQAYEKLAKHHSFNEQQLMEVALKYFLSKEETWFGEKVLVKD